MKYYFTTRVTWRTGCTLQSFWPTWLWLSHNKRTATDVRIGMTSLLTIVAVGLAVYWFAVEARAERAKRAGEITLYRAPLGLRMLLGLASLAMVYGAGSVALSSTARHDWWVSGLIFAMAMFCLSQWPANLGLSKAGIYEQKWFGLRRRTFRWEEIASATHTASDDCVSIVSNSGYTIKHSKYHVDRIGFIAEVKTHCRWLEPGRPLA
jgi:hypothetical protein